MAKLYTTKELEKLLKAGPAWLELGRLNKNEHAALVDILEKSADGKQVRCQFKNEEPASLFDEVEGVDEETLESEVEESEEEAAPAPQFDSNDDFPVTVRTPTAKAYTKKVMDFALLIPSGKNGTLPGEVFSKKLLQVTQGVLARLGKKEDGKRWVAGQCSKDETKIRIWRV